MPGDAPQNVDGMLNEMNGYVSYLEDLSKTDKSNLAVHNDKLRSVGERLLALAREGRDHKR